MKFIFFLTLFVLSNNRTYSQVSDSIQTNLKSGTMKLSEFKNIDVLQANVKSLTVDRYTVYFLCQETSKKIIDTICRSVYGITVKGNSLKDPEFLRLLSKFTPPFLLMFNEIMAVDANKEIVLIPVAISIQIR